MSGHQPVLAVEVEAALVKGSQAIRGNGLEVDPGAPQRSLGAIPIMGSSLGNEPESLLLCKLLLSFVSRGWESD